MDKPTRRSVLLGGAAVVGGTAIVGGTTALVGHADGDATRGRYIWAINTEGVVVPSETWTKVPWPKVVLNTTSIRLDRDQATWIFPAATTSGIYAILCNIAWDNARSPTGAAITPPTHRKQARIPQQDTGTPQSDQPVNLGSATDLTYHADLALRGDQVLLSDGSKAYQQQQVTIQAGISPHSKDQRTWVEVYQDSGQPLVCRWDGSSAPDARPPIVGLQAPSIMITKMCDF